MKILKYFEKAWIFAAIAAGIVSIYNLFSSGFISNRVYFPILCAMFCVLIWFNIRGQRKFREKMLDEKPESKKPE